MTMEQHAKAIELQDRIKRIDELLKLCNKILSECHDDSICACIEEVGFIAHPECYRFKPSEVKVVVEAFVNEHKKLREEFERL